MRHENLQENYKKFHTRTNETIIGKINQNNPKGAVNTSAETIVCGRKKAK